MDEPQNKGPNAHTAYMVVAMVSAAASFLIALVALSKFTQVTDSAMWAMAVMILAPAVLGIGVSYFVHQSAVTRRRVDGPNQSLQPKSAQEGYFRESRQFEGRGD
jgi:hypothetical protein